ncbi:DUF2637 domain-containing protein [Nocardia brasiliensis]|uniref:DUF2637 domain-containing protein n=1 Tax=Nocardia brasiliensis TaxID=37326 RepID=UPI00245392DE|nr:DUF2637 domain-containing protein [Nocardia brasiliensis]
MTAHEIASRGTVLITVGAFTMDFAGLTALAQDSGYPWWLAWIWPAIIDGLIIVSNRAVVALEGRPGSAYAWCLFALGAIISIGANAVHALPHGVTAACVAAAPPLVLLAVTELSVLLAKHVPNEVAPAADSAAREPNIRALAQNSTVQEVAASLLLSGLTAKEAAQQMGVLPRQVNAWAQAALAA